MLVYSRLLFTFLFCLFMAPACASDNHAVKGTTQDWQYDTGGIDFYSDTDASVNLQSVNKITVEPIANLPNAEAFVYRLNKGDFIQIHIYDEQDLSMRVSLNSIATFSYPFLGEISASNLTIRELEVLIANGLRGRYLIDPKVNITIVEYRKFFINGQVKQPGGYAFQPGLTVQKAIILAGGFTNRASKDRIYVIHDVTDSGDRANIGLNDPIKPGDIITIEQSFF